jgi:hypothetical protein
MHQPVKPKQAFGSKGTIGIHMVSAATGPSIPHAASHHRNPHEVLRMQKRDCLIGKIWCKGSINLKTQALFEFSGFCDRAHFMLI